MLALMFVLPGAFLPEALARGGRISPGPRALPGGNGAPDVTDREARRDEFARRGAPTTGPSAPPREQPTATPDDTSSIVGVRHGKVTLIADLARVEMTLSVSNRTSRPLEWRERYVMGQHAELVGALLQRAATATRQAQTVEARTLPTAAARDIYQRIRTWRPPTQTPRTPNKDPLRIERPQRDLLDLSLWPVAPGESVDIILTFVTPLRGRGVSRIYEDVLWVPATQRASSAGRARKGGDLVVMAGDLVLDREPEGLTLVDERDDGRLCFTSTRAANVPAAIPFLVPNPVHDAISIRGGAFGARTAVWRFDPAAFARTHAIKVLRGDSLRLLPVRGSTSRIAPHAFQMSAEPMAVAARVSRTAPKLQYVVAHEDADGKEVARYDVSLPIRREALDEAARGAITGWHRAALARRVLDWAGTDRIRVTTAIDYAVNLGVLVTGTSALAVPADELRILPSALRTRYRTEGATLGAQRREAEMKSPPLQAMQAR
jgi:hypothetical protein